MAIQPDETTISYKGKTVPFDRAEPLIREIVEDAIRPTGGRTKSDAELEELARNAWGAGIKGIDPISRTITLDMDKAGEMARELTRGPGARLRALEKSMELVARLVRELGPEDLYPAPFGRFGSLDFLPAPDLAWIANGLIDECDEFEHIRSGGEQIAYCWKRKGGAKSGKSNLGFASKTSGMTAHFSESTWVVWLAADTVGAYGLTRLQVEAALYHELLHIGEEEDDRGNKKAAVWGHDWEGFAKEIARYGAWQESLQLIRDAWEQLPLFGKGS